MAAVGLIDWLARQVSPRWALERARARVALDAVRHYDAASIGRRTQGWKRSSGDANAAISGKTSRLRDHARDLVRNNPHANSGLNTIVDHAVGWGIVPSTEDRRAAKLWEQWGGTTACDAEGRNDIYGIEKLVMRTIAEAGEVLVRRRLRRPEDGLPLPMQLQVLEPDYLDESRTGVRLPNGGRIVQGVEFDAIGRTVAYWLFPEHPGSSEFFAASSVRVPAENIIHIFRKTRPGQVRGVSWFAPIILTLKQWDEYQDAQLMKQLIAACLAVILTDPDGTPTPIGVSEAGSDPTQLELDRIGPGLIHMAPPGRTATVVDPPSVGDIGPYAQVTLRTIATGLGVPYEDLTGDYAQMPFSAARMSRLSHWTRVEDWRWGMLIPQFCIPVWAWAMEVGAIFGQVGAQPAVTWTAPPLPMIDPGAEGLAYQRNVRAGIMSLSEALRERGYEPKAVLNELAADFKMLDELGLVLDSDPRKMTQQGQFQQEPAAPEESAAEEAPEDTESAADRMALRTIAMKQNGSSTTPGFYPRFSVEKDAVSITMPAVNAGTTIEKGAIHVEAPTTIAAGAIQTDTKIDSPVTIEKDAIRLDAPVTTTIADGALKAEVPITIAEHVHVPAGRKVVERDDEGRITGIVTEADVGEIVSKPKRRGKKKPNA